MTHPLFSNTPNLPATFPNEAVDALLGPLAENAKALSDLAWKQLLTKDPHGEGRHVYGASISLLAYVEGFIDATSAPLGATYQTVISKRAICHIIDIINGIDNWIASPRVDDPNTYRAEACLFAQKIGMPITKLWRDYCEAERSGDLTKVDENGGWIMPANPSRDDEVSNAPSM